MLYTAFYIRIFPTIDSSEVKASPIKGTVSCFILPAQLLVPFPPIIVLALGWLIARGIKFFKKFLLGFYILVKNYMFMVTMVNWMCFILEDEAFVFYCYVGNCAIMHRS